MDPLREALAYRPTRLDLARHEVGHCLGHIACLVPLGAAPIHDPQWLASAPDCDVFQVAVILHVGALAEGTHLGAQTDLQRIAEIHRGWVADTSPSSPGGCAARLVAAFSAEIDAAAYALCEGPLTMDQLIADHFRLALGVVVRPRGATQRKVRPAWG